MTYYVELNAFWQGLLQLGKLYPLSGNVITFENGHYCEFVEHHIQQGLLMELDLS